MENSILNLINVNRSKEVKYEDIENGDLVNLIKIGWTDSTLFPVGVDQLIVLIYQK